VDKCPTCGGAGMGREQATVEVKVPPGVDTGTRLKLSGEGEPAPHPAPSPATSTWWWQVREHPIFRREDTEVVCEMPISFTQAALGTQIDVPTLDGPVKMKIPAGTQSGKVFRLRGKGVPALGGGGRGDQHVRVMVETRPTSPRSSASCSSGWRRSRARRTTAGARILVAGRDLLGGKKK